MEVTVWAIQSGNYIRNHCTIHCFYSWWWCILLMVGIKAKMICFETRFFPCFLSSTALHSSVGTDSRWKAINCAIAFRCTCHTGAQPTGCTANQRMGRSCESHAAVPWTVMSHGMAYLLKSLCFYSHECIVLVGLLGEIPLVCIFGF